MTNTLDTFNEQVNRQLDLPEGYFWTGFKAAQDSTILKGQLVRKIDWQEHSAEMAIREMLSDRSGFIALERIALALEALS